MTSIELSEIIEDGSDVLIVLDSRKRWLTKAITGKQFHCHKGFFDFDQIMGKPYGISVKTNKSIELTIYKPIPSDFLKQIPHDMHFSCMILLFSISIAKTGQRIMSLGWAFLAKQFFK